MNKPMTFGAGLLAGLVLAGGAAFAAAQGFQHHRMKMMKHLVSARIERMEDSISATPQQRAVIEQAKSEVFAAIQSKAQARTRGQLVALLTADTLDTNALYAIANQRSQDIQDLAKVIVPELQRVHDTLTPAQRQLLAQKAQQHLNDHGGFGGPEE